MSKFKLKKKIVIPALVILLLIAVWWAWHGNMFSKSVLKLEILGSEKVKAGDQIEYTVKYKNNGNFVLQNPRLVFNLPDYAITDDGKTRITQDLEDIYPGDENFIKIKARLLGKEGDVEVAKATLSYTPKNLSSEFSSETTFSSQIDSSAITLNFDLPSKIEKGKDVQYDINYFSNVDMPLDNLSIKVQPVPGFTITSSEPSSLDKQEWKLPTLNKGQGGRITIKGHTQADLNQTLPFVADLGVWKNGNFVVLKETKQDVSVIQSMLLLSQTINGATDYIASPGDTLNYQISFANMGSSPFSNLFLIVRLNGQALDMSSIQASGAKVQQGDNMIIFDSNSFSQLRNVDVRESGNVSFTVKVKDDWVPSNADQDELITDQVDVADISQKFSIKVNAGLTLEQKGFFQNQDFDNSGPVPPKVGQATTYTITWSIKNYAADQKNVKVKATLPKNVSLTGKILPEDESSHFSYDSSSREIVWSAGDILSKTGVNGDPVVISFQVSLTPTIDQQGSVAKIMSGASITGENQFTNNITIFQVDPVTTSLLDDSANGKGGVVQ